MATIDDATHIAWKLMPFSLVELNGCTKATIRAWPIYWRIMMTIRKAVLASALLLPALSNAGDFSYDYLEAGYGRTEIDVGEGADDVDGDGLSIAGSLAVAPNWHLFTDLSTADLDFDIDATTIRVGGGYNYPISERADLIARVSYVSVELDTPVGDLDEDGFGVGVGLRAEIAPNFELEGAIDYVDLGGGSDGDTSVSAEGRYFFTPAFAVGAGIEVGDDTKTYAITARYNFR